MSIACSSIRDQPHYRKSAFVDGLKHAGYLVVSSADSLKIGPGDVFVSWNLYGSAADNAERFKSRGASVIVCENGYVGKDAEGRQYYALALDGHNGSGRWPEPEYDRLSKLNIEFKPWRDQGNHILVCGARGIGPPGIAQPAGWELLTAQRLKKITKRPIRIRPHPGNSAPTIPLADDLKDCWAVVTWASNCATEALIAGIPVHYCGPYIATAGAATPGIESIEDPPTVDRMETFQRLAWQQWSVDEIQSGEPFERLRIESH